MKTGNYTFDAQAGFLKEFGTMEGAMSLFGALRYEFPPKRNRPLVKNNNHANRSNKFKPNMVNSRRGEGQVKEGKETSIGFLEINYLEICRKRIEDELANTPVGQRHLAESHVRCASAPREQGEEAAAGPAIGGQMADEQVVGAVETRPPRAL